MWPTCTNARIHILWPIRVLPPNTYTATLVNMVKSDDDSHATASLNGEETPRLIDLIDLETADYKTLLSVPQIGAKRAMGIMTMRTYSQLSIFNVSETTGLKEEVISRLILSGRITDLPKHVEGMNR